LSLRLFTTAVKASVNVERTLNVAKGWSKHLPWKFRYRHQTRVPHPSSAWVGKHDPHQRFPFFPGVATAINDCGCSLRAFQPTKC